MGSSAGCPLTLPNTPNPPGLLLAVRELQQIWFLPPDKSPKYKGPQNTSESIGSYEPHHSLLIVFSLLQLH
jgi:hypothetical protein